MKRKSYLIKSNFQLAICLLLDGIGMITYLFPGISEWFDLFWAPLAAITYWAMFGGLKGFIGSIFVFIEEVLPLTDSIPSFTLSWLLWKKRNKLIKSKLVTVQ
ncbi:MAG: hypothetical protein N2167_04170 [Flavobacteriales bacterium]|nr:hypothetical protein [Flavobacteriales bacterium]